MSEAEILNWISTLWPGPLVRGSNWLAPFAEILHFLGLCLLFGGLILVDVRLLGFFKRLPGKAVLAFTNFAIVGFLINLASGWAFFSAVPTVYWGNMAFQMKMAIILLAGVNALVFTIVDHRRIALLGPGEDTSALSKITAALSLTMWFAVLLLGRMLPAFVNSQN